MVAFKDLVIGVTGQFKITVRESLVNGEDHGLIVLHLLLGIFEDIVEAVGLLLGTAKDEVSNAFLGIGVELFDQQVELLVERGLRLGVKDDLLLWLEVSVGLQVKGGEVVEL